MQNESISEVHVEGSVECDSLVFDLFFSSRGSRL